MIEMLRDAVWQFIGVILALLALLVSIWIYIRQKTRKVLVWDSRRVIPLLNIDKSVQDEMQIIFRGHAVREAYMVSITFANRGNVPITRQDYDNNAAITISVGGEIVSLDTYDNKDIEINGTFDETGHIYIDPLLLNAKEEVKIKAIIINCTPTIDAASRIVGGTFMSIDQYDDTPRQKIIRVIAKSMDPQGGTLIGAAAVASVAAVIFTALGVLGENILSVLHFLHISIN
jgi:hypothetical protein